MKILLTGATGFLGFRTLERLIEAENITEIIASGRSKKPTHIVNHQKVTYILGDLNDSNYVNKITQNVDIIIHAAALSSPWGKKETFYKANVIPQGLLIEAGKKQQVQKFIFISSPSIYFNAKHRINILESDDLPKKLVNAYAETKMKAEAMLSASDLPYIILRPRALTGRGDTVIMPRLIRANDEGKLRIIGNGENLADLTPVSNVVDAILLSLAAKGKALNEDYNITNGEPVNLWDSISYVLKLLNKQVPQKKIPYKLVYAIASFMELSSKLTHYKEPALTKYGVGTLAKSTTFNIDKAKQLLGYQPKMTTKESIQEFAKWYLENEKH